MNTIEKLKQCGRDQPYQTPLKVTVVKKAETRRYENDGKARTSTSLGFGDKTDAILGICYDEDKLRSMIEGKDVMLRNYIFRDHKIIITSQTVVSRTSAVGPLSNSVTERAKTAVQPQDSPLKSISEAKAVGIGQVVSIQARIVKVEEKAERTLQKTNKKVDFRSVTVKDQSDEISLSLWRDFASMDMIVGKTYKFFNLKTSVYNQKMLLNNTFNTRMEIVETPVLTDLFVIEGYSIEDTVVSLVCRSPNTENYQDFTASKAEIECLVGDDDDLDNLLVALLPLEVNITFKENDTNVISITL